jgi:hypothetical protein
MPVKVSVTEFSRRPNETTLSGSIENRGTTSKTYNLSIDLLDKSGNVIDTQTTTVGPVAPKSSQKFSLKSAKGGAYGYRYKPVT